MAAGDEEKARRYLDEASDIKKHLPIFCYQATFKFGKRSIKTAEPNGLVMCDFDGIDDLRNVILGFPKRIGTWRSVGVVLVHITPSHRGLRVVFKGDFDKTYVENQHWMADMLGLTLDEACKDLARCSFAVPESHILFLDSELFTYSNPLKDQKNENNNEKNQGLFRESAGDASYSDDSANDVRSCISDSAVTRSERVACEDSVSSERPPIDWETTDGKLSFKGIPYETIIKEWWEQTGGEPKMGERNTKLHRLATNLRYVCDNNEDLLLAVMPRYGLSEAEMKALIHSAVSPRMMWTQPRFLSASLLAAQAKNSTLSAGREIRLNEGEFMTKNENEYWLGRLEEIKLPAGLKETTESVATDNKLNAIIACLPIIYTAATGISYKIWDGMWYRLSGTSVLIGAAASGKSFMKNIVNAWLSPIRLADMTNRQIENDYKTKRDASGTKGMKSTRPSVCIRQLPATASLATLNLRSQNAKRVVWNVPHTKEYTQHVHLVTVEYEFATVVKSLKQNFSSYLDFLIKSHQDEQVGVDYMNDASANGIRNIHWNQLYAGNLMDFKKLIPDNSVLNGMPLRLMIGFIPENNYEMNVQQGILSAHRRSVILDIAYKLDKLTGNVDVRELSDHMFNWSRQKAKEAESRNDKVADYIRRRCGSTIGMRAGVISAVIRNLKQWEQLSVTVLNEEKYMTENEKEFARVLKFTEDDFKFASLIADYCFEQQIKLFRRPMEKAFEESILPSSGVIFNNETERTIALFESLPKTFDAFDVSKTFEVTMKTARTYCSKWKREGKIKYNKQLKKFSK